MNAVHMLFREALGNPSFSKTTFFIVAFFVYAYSIEGNRAMAQEPESESAAATFFMKYEWNVYTSPLEFIHEVYSDPDFDTLEIDSEVLFFTELMGITENMAERYLKTYEYVKSVFEEQHVEPVFDVELERHFISAESVRESYNDDIRRRKAQEDFTEDSINTGRKGIIAVAGLAGILAISIIYRKVKTSSHEE
jgi:hypothetical protein